MASASSATVAQGSVAVPCGNVVVSVFSRFVGPAALTAAGMIGAGAVATRLLAGAWFGFDLLWVALYVIPIVIVTLDSASRVAAVSAGRGMLDMVRGEIGWPLAWAVFPAAFGANILVIFYFVNQRRMGEFRANSGRNTLLALTLLFALTLAVIGVVRFFR